MTGTSVERPKRM